MVLEISPEYAENKHFLGQTQDPERMQRFQEEQCLKFKLNLQIIQNEHPGL